jgi:hypothetical protein
LHVTRLADLHVMGQLDLAAQYWHISEMHTDPWWSHTGKKKDALGDRLRLMERVAAYCFVVNAEAWRQFCERLGIDALYVVKAVGPKQTMAANESATTRRRTTSEATT